MSSILVFPGQGSQSVGMGRELYENNAAARAVFDEVDDALGQKLSDIIFNGPMEDLTLTTNVQPAIMATSIAMLRAANVPLTQYVAGHSLGEYTALCAAGALSLADTAKLLRLRGDAMQRAVPVGRGMTAVILGLDIDVVREICAKNDCDVANDNSPGQVVISGSREIVEKTLEDARAAGARRAMPLALSVISNKTCTPISDPDEIRDALVYQITHGVRWRESVLAMHDLGIDETIEVGPGAVLTGLTKRICCDMEGKKLEV